MSVVQRDSKIVLRSPGAVAAALPSLVGFVPEESLVVVFLAEGVVVVTMRVDLPSDVAEVADYVASTGIRVQADELIGIMCCRKPDADLPCRDGVDAVVRSCEDAGLSVRDFLLIDEGWYWSYTCANAECCSPEGTAISTDDQLAMERVGDGLPVAAASRDELAARFVPRPDLAARDATREAGERILEVPLAQRAELVWDAVRMLARLGGTSTDLDGILRTRVTVAISNVRVRDYVLGRMAQAHDVRPLLDALVRTALTAPEDLREPIAAMAAAALAAFGESTVAVRCLVDIAGEQSLARLMEACVQAAVPPAELRALLVEALPVVLTQLGASAPSEASTSEVDTTSEEAPAS